MTKISFCVFFVTPYFDFCPKFRVLVKISIFVQNSDFCPKFRFSEFFEWNFRKKKIVKLSLPQLVPVCCWGYVLGICSWISNLLDTVRGFEFCKFCISVSSCHMKSFAGSEYISAQSCWRSSISAQIYAKTNKYQFLRFIKNLTQIQIFRPKFRFLSKI